jgi:hypothetical protein
MDSGLLIARLEQLEQAHRGWASFSERSAPANGARAPELTTPEAADADERG